jgi:hypothetical protein
MNTTVQVEPAETESAEASTYYSPARVFRICSTCEILSWFALILGAFSVIVWAWFLYGFLALANYHSLSAFLQNASPLVILFGMAALICLFFWVFLRAIAEGLYLLVDIQENQKTPTA